MEKLKGKFKGIPGRAPKEFPNEFLENIFGGLSGGNRWRKPSAPEEILVRTWRGTLGRNIRINSWRNPMNKFLGVLPRENPGRNPRKNVWMKSPEEFGRKSPDKFVEQSARAVSRGNPRMNSGTNLWRCFWRKFPWGISGENSPPWGLSREILEIPEKFAINSRRNFRS